MAKEPRVTVTETRAQNEDYQARQEREAASAQAHKDAPEHSITQKSALPVDENNQTKEARELQQTRQKQDDFERKHEKELAEGKQTQKGFPRMEDHTARVRLLRGYVPESYVVMEGNTPRLMYAGPGAVLDKVQATQVIALRPSEANKLLSAKIAEKDDDQFHVE
jgi:hypothetical protein